MSLIFLPFISVVKMKFKAFKRRSLVGRKVNTVYKTWRGTPSEMRKLRKPKLQLTNSDECCSQWIRDQPKKTRFLVMGKNQNNSLVPTFIVPWSRDKVSDMRGCGDNDQNVTNEIQFLQSKLFNSYFINFEKWE